MQVVLYEDAGTKWFGPLTLLRPVFDLRCGSLLLREKLEVRRPGWAVNLLPRPELTPLVSELYPGRGIDGLQDSDVLLLSARVIVTDELLAAIEAESAEALLTSGGEPVGALLRGGAAERVRAVGEANGDLSVLDMPLSRELPARVVCYPWELVRLTAEEIEADAAVSGRLGTVEGDVHPSAHLVEPARISIGEGSTLGPGVVIDASSGAVVVDANVEVMANAVILGPAFVGAGSFIKVGARIYPGTSIGRSCKVGGEVEGSVLHSFTNKQHEGFLGHAYLGSWVNIGAATDNSDLKNNYGSVRVELNGETVDTGHTSVGATIGDHTKTAIGTKLNTGTVIGVFCNVVSNGFAPKSIPSFSWGNGDGFVEHDIERAIATARIVMARRGVDLTGTEEAVIREVHRRQR
ncbi:hypothetical protein KAW64_08045 [bacterium]|nr:hypothetical protein [bacterium]